jgi:hypothetical protein
MKDKETLEKAAERLYPNEGYNEEVYCDIGELSREIFIEGAKWQAERMYSEEEVKQIIELTLIEYSDFVLADIPHWFENFKK